MPIQAPTLSARDLEEELRRIHARPHRTFTTAFYGAPATGLQSLTVTSGENEVIEFRVAHATCELLARRALVGAAGGPLVLLVDFDGRLPLDVTSRLAGGKVRAVTEERRLARLFGARSVSGDLLASPLKAALLADGDGGYGELPGVTLDLETAWRKYLVKMVNFPADAPLSEERLIYHCIRDLDPLGFRQVLRARSDLREALHNFLGERAGPVARLAWRAWERGVGMEVAAFVFILQAAKEALATSEYLQAWLNLRLADLDPELRNAVRGQPELLDRWGALADRLSLQFPDDAGLDEVLVVAERQLSDDRLKETLGHSRYLPSALLRGKQSLAAALGAGLAEPSLATLNEARIRLIAVEAHRLRVREPHKRQFDRARMAVRLVGYRTARTDVQAHSAVDVVAELASAYARDGGFVDWARTAARGARTDALDDAIAAVVSSLDEVRDEMDRQFAMALPEWSAHRKTVGRIVPIDQALDRFAVEFLTGGEHRRLVVLLLDGMAWANAVELLLDLEDHRWGPVRWQPKNATGDLLPPMLAALPTLTEVSRAAFFAGHLMESGERRGTG
ncbi:MAG TPA: BREX-2 system phosphatase PglZ, partial [Clostridia bacterium]|nr:BREX-2 system phosphatase PglZ [Clostridia bacterium]